MSLRGFLGKYSGELAGIVSILSTVVGSLPLDRGDKDRIGGVLDGLRDAVKSISDAVEGMVDDADIVIKKSDIEEAVASQLPQLVMSLEMRLRALEEANKKDGPNDA